MVCRGVPLVVPGLPSARPGPSSWMATMPGVPTLEHFGLVAPRDKFEAMLKFYEEVFGWHRIREVGDTIVFIGDGQGGRLELIVNDVPPLPSPHHGA